MTTQTTIRKTGSSFQNWNNQPYLKNRQETTKGLQIGKQTVKSAAQAMTLIAYGDSHNLPFRNLDFVTKCDDFTDWKECINIIQSYNEFDAALIVKKAFWYLTLRHFLNENNANNGKDLFRFSIGREGSPSFYVEYNEYFDNKIIKDTEEQGATETTPQGTILFWEEYTSEDFKKDMQKLSNEIKADEFNIEESEGYGGKAYFKARFWFD